MVHPYTVMPLQVMDEGKGKGKGNKGNKGQ